MNLICNNCFTGFFQKKNNLRYETPFVWNRINPKDFIYLMEHFDTINFNDIELKCNKDVKRYKELSVNMKSFCIIIENEVFVFYNHYKYRAEAKTPVIETPDVYYYRNFEYTLNKYNERLKRMDKTKTPIFIYHSNTTNRANESENWKLIDKKEDLEKMIDIANKKKYKFIAITQFQELENFNSDNILILYLPTTDKTYWSFPKMVDKYNDEILEFINEHN